MASKCRRTSAPYDPYEVVLLVCNPKVHTIHVVNATCNTDTGNYARSYKDTTSWIQYLQQSRQTQSLTDRHLCRVCRLDSDYCALGRQ